MAKKSRMSILKRQREVKKREKAARKRAKRHGRPIEPLAEPVPTASLVRPPSEDEDSRPAAPAETSSNGQT